MTISIKHQKNTGLLPDWTQTVLDDVIAGNPPPLPPAGTNISSIVLPSDFAADHVIDTTGTSAGAVLYADSGSVNASSGLAINITSEAQLSIGDNATGQGVLRLYDFINGDWSRFIYDDATYKFLNSGGNLADIAVSNITAGYLFLNSLSPSLSPLVITGAASQTANLSSWRNSSNTVLASISADGLLRLPNGTAALPSISFASGTNTGFYSSAAGRVAFSSGASPVIQLASTDLRLASNIGLTFNNATNVTTGSIDLGISRNATGILEVNTGTPGAWAALRIGAPTATTVPAIVRGAASQTADLQQWQNSAGTKTTYIDSVGSIFSNVNVGSGNAFWFFNQNLLMYATAATLTKSNNAYTFADNTGGTLMQIKASSMFLANTTAVTLTTNAKMAAIIGTSTEIGAIIRGAASQTANLTQWENSGGTVLATIKSTGVLNLPSFTVATLPTGANNDRAFVTDALGPVWGSAVVGGGAVRVPVYFDGAWKVG